MGRFDFKSDRILFVLPTCKSEIGLDQILFASPNCESDIGLDQIMCVSRNFVSEFSFYFIQVCTNTSNLISADKFDLLWIDLLQTHLRHVFSITGQ